LRNTARIRTQVLWTDTEFEQRDFEIYLVTFNKKKKLFWKKLGERVLQDIWVSSSPFRTVKKGQNYWIE